MARAKDNYLRELLYQIRLFKDYLVCFVIYDKVTRLK